MLAFKDPSPEPASLRPLAPNSGPLLAESFVPSHAYPTKTTNNKITSSTNTVVISATIYGVFSMYQDLCFTCILKKIFLFYCGRNTKCEIYLHNKCLRVHYCIFSLNSHDL